MIKLALIGDGGHCSSYLDMIEKIKGHKVCYILTNYKKKKIYGINCLPDSNKSYEFLKKKKINNIVIAIGQIRDYNIRKKIYDKLRNYKFNIPTLLSKNSIISSTLKIGIGSVIMQNTFINYGVRIGYNTIINNSCNIEHGVVIGDNCHISTGVIINGDCQIGNNCFIGSGTIIKQGIKIKNNSFIKMGSIIK